jgi:Na+/H+ antiporter NhaD/arsenite permease-like protein
MTIPTVLTCLGVLVAVQALPQHGGAPGLVWQAYPELNQQITLLNGVEGASTRVLNNQPTTTFGRGLVGCLCNERSDWLVGWL